MSSSASTPPPLPPARPGRGPGRGILIVVAIGVLVVVVGVGGLALGLGFTRTGSVSSTGPAHRAPAVPSAAPSPTGPMPKTDPRLAAYYHQRLHWRGCPGGVCSWLRVPLDYAKPSGQSIRLRVLKVPASDQSHKVGALVVNPGGPGASGVQYAAAASVVFRPQLTEKFDIVGFDPRGVGQSDPLTCLDTSQLDSFIASDPDPATAAERLDLDSMTHAFGEACLRHSGDLARHMSTEEAARDIDILRSALGERRLDYFGASYGTFLGATYANLFPHHVGRMVLDGAIDPKLSNHQLSLAQAHGFEIALRSYLASCLGSGQCSFLGSSVDAAAHRIRTLLDATDTTPLPTQDGRKLTEGLATLGVWMPLYEKSLWPQLTAGLKEAIDDHSGNALLSMADIYTSRGPHGYTDNSINALYDVNCLDHDDYVPTAKVPSYFPQFLKASPTFGKDFAFSLSTCAAWPIKSHRHTVALHAAGAPPIVVMGTTRDPATPLAWAKGLASELRSGVLVIRDGDGHTGYNQGSECADEAVENYLISDRVPKNGTVCH